MASKFIFTAFIIQVFFIACNPGVQPGDAPGFDTVSAEKKINAMLDSFNMAAARADFKSYFNFYSEGAIFTGTDATERWEKKAFMTWAKPYFDKGSTWNFTALERHIYFDKTGELSWFDELLKTQMKICRGSGVLAKQGDYWKIQQYILSVTVPNELVDTMVELKASIEDKIINQLSKRQ